MTLLARLTGGVPARSLWCLGLLLVLLLAAPALLGKYGLSVLILVLYFAFVGQAWNIMMGFAGQLSLGHALYAGVGGYIAAGLFFHYGIGPWAGVFVAVAAAVAAGSWAIWASASRWPASISHCSPSPSASSRASPSITGAGPAARAGSSSRSTPPRTS
jgi:hypothetical protein